MKRHNGFERGMGGTFPCDVCDRQTRHTGEQALGCNLCPECWNAAGIENEWQDGMIEEAEAIAQLREYRDAAVAKGGDAAKINAASILNLD
jgi:hypothetical protein